MFLSLVLKAAAVRPTAPRTPRRDLTNAVLEPSAVRVITAITRARLMTAGDKLAPQRPSTHSSVPVLDQRVGLDQSGRILAEYQQLVPVAKLLE